MEIEFLKNKKLQIRFIVVCSLIFLAMLVKYLYENYQLESNNEKIYVPVTVREVDYKNRVTIIAKFAVKNKVYYSQEVITNYEKQNDIRIDVGDTVGVLYYVEDPSNNDMLIRANDFYKK
jgi:translation initiation factor IF-1